MKPQARIQAVIDVLTRTEDSRVPMDTVLGDYMRHRRYIGSKDRAYIAETTYGIVRHTARLAWHLQRHDAAPTPRNRMIAYLALLDDRKEKDISGLFDNSKYAPETLNEEEQKLLDALNNNTLHHSDMPEAVRCECPPEYEERLRTLFGEDFEQEMNAMLGTAYLDLRVNTILATREKSHDYLEADGVKTDPTILSPWGLRVRGKAYLARTKAFNKGWIEIQDEGSQLITMLSDAKPGMQVMDYCAGAGGKTLGLAAAMECKGRIIAMDNDARRLEKGRKRYRKARVADIIEVRPLSENRHKKWLRRQKEKFDRVLTDVPCSGSGTWRRNPDMRWRVYGPPLEELTAIQSDILEKVAPVVKKGGNLIYATCSLLKEENEEQIARFLENNKDFEIDPVDPSLGIGSPFMCLTPHRHQTDGFFCAVLKKKDN